MSGPADPEGGEPGRRDPRRRPDPGEAWNVVGTLVAGLAFWGFVGFAIDRITGVGTVFLPIGVAVGVAAGLYLIIYRMLH
jgi:F0F1-type ATP synthase assembly protein I